MAETQAETGAAAATGEAGSLLDQAIQATKQTEPDRAKELLKTLTEEALKGTVTYSKNLTQTFNKAITAIDEQLSKQLAAIMQHPDFQKPRRLLARPALLGDEFGDGFDLEAAHAQRVQEGPASRSQQGGRI